MDIQVKPIAESRISQLNIENIQFGKLYADHMFMVDFEHGEWGTPQIVPFGPLTMSPATTFMHYGQAIFEGIKAYRTKDNEVMILIGE